MRVTGWPQILAEKVEEWRHRPMAYGSADCFQWAAECVLSLTGEEHRGKFPAYASREEADAILATHGGAAGLISGVLGEPKPVARAMRGDLVAADFGDGVAPAVCLGVYCCTPGPKGLAFLPTLRAIAAWSV